MLNEKLARLRLEAGLTQEQLAGIMCVSRELVSKWERGTRKPDINALKRLAGTYGCGPEYLLEDENGLLPELESCLPGNGAIAPERLPGILGLFLHTLSVRDRGVFVRRYYFLDTPADIAAAFDIKEDYVRTLLSRTRKKLKKYLEEEAAE